MNGLWLSGFGKTAFVKGMICVQWSKNGECGHTYTLKVLDCPQVVGFTFYIKVSFNSADGCGPCLVCFSFFFFFFFSGKPKTLSSAKEQQAIFLSLVNEWIHPPAHICNSVVDSNPSNNIACAEDQGVTSCPGSATSDFSCPCLFQQPFGHIFTRNSCCSWCEPHFISPCGCNVFQPWPLQCCILCPRQPLIFYDGLNQDKTELVGPVQKLPTCINHVMFVSESLL